MSKNFAIYLAIFAGMTISMWSANGQAAVSTCGVQLKNAQFRVVTNSSRKVKVFGNLTQAMELVEELTSEGKCDVLTNETSFCTWRKRDHYSVLYQDGVKTGYVYSSPELAIRAQNYFKTSGFCRF